MTAQRRILASLAVAALARAGVSDSLMSFTAPFNFINPKSGERTVPNFDVLGHAVVNENFIRLTPDRQSKRGGIVSTVPVAKGPLREFSAVVRFRIAGQGQTLFGDGLAMWFTRGEGRRQWDAGAELHGVGASFTGFGVVIDTFQNPERPHKDVSVLVSDGSRAGSVEEIAANAPGCAAALRFHEERADFSALNASALRVTYTRGALAIDVDEGDTGAWRECARLKHLPGLAPPNMPDDGAAQPPGASEAAGWPVAPGQPLHISLTATTGALADNHDVLSFELFGSEGDARESEEKRRALRGDLKERGELARRVTLGEGDLAEVTRAANDGVSAEPFALRLSDELDEYKHHVEHQLEAVYDRIAHTKRGLEDQERLAEDRIEQLEERVSEPSEGGGDCGDARILTAPTRSLRRARVSSTLWSSRRSRSASPSSRRRCSRTPRPRSRTRSRGA